MSENVETKAPEPAAAQPAEQSKTKKVASISAIIVGIMLLVAGIFSMTGNEELDNAFIQTGAEQAVSNVIAQYPEVEEYAERAAVIISAAVEGRSSNPEALADVLYDTVSQYTVPGAKTIMVAIINQVNTAYAASETEEQYWKKLTILVQGIRDGIKRAHQ